LFHYEYGIIFQNEDQPKDLVPNIFSQIHSFQKIWTFPDARFRLVPHLWPGQEQVKYPSTSCSPPTVLFHFHLITQPWMAFSWANNFLPGFPSAQLSRCVQKKKLTALADTFLIGFKSNYCKNSKIYYRMSCIQGLTRKNIFV
jgi:hypothetical protein